MKPITIILLLCTHAVVAQVKVTEVKMKFGSEFHKAKDPDIIYPVITASDKIVERKINQTILFELTRIDSTESLSKTLLAQMNEGLSELDYDISLNTKDLLSLKLNALGCGAYCSTYNIYFNFDLHTGESLRIQDIITKKGLDSFRAVVLKDKIKALKRDRKEKDSLLSAGTIDSSDYHIVMENEQQCIGEVNTDRFLLFKNEIEIIDPCEFPHVIQALQPVYHLRYSYRKIKKFINRTLLDKLKLSVP
jgi:hypothetical protein